MEIRGDRHQYTFINTWTFRYPSQTKVLIQAEKQPPFLVNHASKFSSQQGNLLKYSLYFNKKIDVAKGLFLNSVAFCKQCKSLCIQTLNRLTVFPMRLSTLKNRKAALIRSCISLHIIRFFKH